MSKKTQISKVAVTLAALLPLMSVSLEAGIVPYVTSAPGIGKSSVAKQYAKTHNLKFVDVRLAGYDPTIIDGFAMVNRDTQRAFFGIQEQWPIESDPLPFNQEIFEQNLELAFNNGEFSKEDFENKTDTYNAVAERLKPISTYDGWFILLDELPSAPIAVQNAAYRLILDKEVGAHKLHPKVQMMAAGNRLIDNTNVNRVGTALQSRVIHYEVKSDYQAFKDWAIKAQINPRVLAYVDFKPEVIDGFDPDHTDCTFACGRTLEFLSKQVEVAQSKGMDLAGYNMLPLYAGTIGYAHGAEFQTFMSVFGQIPDINQILSNPTGIPLPTEPSQIHAIAAMVGENLTPSNASVLMKFLTRTPAESQVTALKTAISRNHALANVPEVHQWTLNVAQKIRRV